MYNILNKAKGIECIRTRDKYIETMSKTVMQCKMDLDDELSRDRFLLFLEECIIEFTEGEKEKLESSLERMYSEFERFTYKNIVEVNIVKTSGKDEWNSAYTRGNTIYLPRKKIEIYSEEELYDLLLHEYFHIHSRCNPEIRNQLYKLMGFKEVNKSDIKSSLIEKVIFNPDAMSIVSTDILHEGKVVEIVPLIIMDNINIDTSLDITKSIKIKGYIKKYDLVKDINEFDLLKEKLLVNTDFPQHPEETLAENFVYLFKKNKEDIDTKLLESMKNILIN
jgi:hypothetical protein